MATQPHKLSIFYTIYDGHLRKPPTCNATSRPRDVARPISDAVGVRTSAPDLTHFNCEPHMRRPYCFYVVY
jgi:hypothetical protein